MTLAAFTPEELVAAFASLDSAKAHGELSPEAHAEAKAALRAELEAAGLEVVPVLDDGVAVGFTLAPVGA